MGERDERFAKGYRKFVGKLRKTPADELTKLIRRRRGQLKTDEQKAVTLRAWWRELERRAENRALGMRHGHRWRANQAAVKWAMQDMPMPLATEHERRALIAYTGSGCSFINNGLLGWSVPTKPAEKLRFDRHLGKTFTEPAFISTSIGNRAAFNGEIRYMFRLPAGYQAFNAMHLSRFGTKEREILIRRDAKYIVHAAYRKGSAWFIEAEIVEDDWTPDLYGDAWDGYP